jgi:autophagy-related protein 5
VALIHDAIPRKAGTDNFEKYWSVASKLIPPPAPPGQMSPTTPAGAPSTLATDGRLPDANAVRSVPLRLYLPEGAPVMQDVVPPMTPLSA